jgi:SAM-dependent methyltransferase
VSSTSSLDELVRYLRERWTGRVALLVPLLAGASLVPAPCAGALDLLGRLALAGTLVLQFRLWDDLADRRRDSIDHPDRVLPRARSLVPFHAALAALLPLNLAVVGLSSPPEALAVLLGVDVAFLAWYGILRSLVPAPVVRAHVLLLKYPVFVFLLAFRPDVLVGTPLIATLVLVYVLLCAYEWWHDPRLRHAVSPTLFLTEKCRMTTLPTPPDPTLFEPVACYYCSAADSSPFVTAQDDYTGKPGFFHFVRCNSCGLAYQSPRIRLDHIKAYYDDEYIAHRKKTDWGLLTPFYRRAMDKHDREKERLVSRFVPLGPERRVLDVGSGAGTFLARLRQRHGCQVIGVDFKDLSQLPGYQGVDCRVGVFYEQDFPENHFDLITMWHFLEHDYDPMRTLATARRLLRHDGRLVIEVPRLDSVTFRLFRERWPGLQAPQHTVLYTKEMLLKCLDRAGWQVVAHLPYGAFPPYFYLFAGVAFKLRRGRGINLARAIYPYFLGQLLLSPLLLFQRRLDLAMQTVICRRP